MSIETVDADIRVDTSGASTELTDLAEELYSILREEWPHHMRDDIRRIQPRESDGKYVVVEWDSDEDRSLLGPHVASLLKHGWAIRGMKGPMLFLAPIHGEGEDDFEYRFEGVSDTYSKTACKVCESREVVEFVPVEVEVDVESRVENNENIPLFHVRHFPLCDECDLPNSLTKADPNGEPDFDPSEHPEYNPN